MIYLFARTFDTARSFAEYHKLPTGNFEVVQSGMSMRVLYPNVLLCINDFYHHPLAKEVKDECLIRGWLPITVSF